MPLKKKKNPRRKIVKKRAIKMKVGKRRVLRKAPARKKRVAQKRRPKENLIGLVTHYFPQVRAAVVKLKAPLSIGDVVKIKGHTTDFTQTVTSIQIDRVPITAAKKGQEIGLLVDSRVRQHDMVYKL
jgi:hypothetical protein